MLPRRVTPACFVTLEGGEGAGKSTQLRLLANALCECGLPVLQTREPGGAPGAERLRELLLSGVIDWSLSAETLLHFAARAEHVAKTIRPALDAGMWVVCDRFYDSTMAYQGWGQSADRLAIETLTGLVGLVPDLTIILDVAPDVAAGRLGRRGGVADRYERQDLAFHARVRAGFRAIAATQPERCELVDANGNESAVLSSILEIVRRRLLPN